jgi:hypothetical protein
MMRILKDAGMTLDDLTDLMQEYEARDLYLFWSTQKRRFVVEGGINRWIVYRTRDIQLLRDVDKVVHMFEEK